MAIFLTLAIIALVLIVLGALLHGLWWLIVLGVVVFLVDWALNGKLLGRSRRRVTR